VSLHLGVSPLLGESMNGTEVFLGFATGCGSLGTPPLPSARNVRREGAGGGASRALVRRSVDRSRHFAVQVKTPAAAEIIADWLEFRPVVEHD
jgi:hypothetical protein